MKKQTKKTAGKGDSVAKDGIQMAGAFVAGVAIAAIAGGYYLFGAKNAKQNRKNVEAWTLKAKADVLTKLEKAKNITQDEYEKIVDGVSDKYAQVKEIGTDKADALRKELKKHWKEIKKEAEELEKKGRKAVAKVTKK
jgi:gas vesicle protein